MRLRFDERNADGSYTLSAAFAKLIAQCGQRLPALEGAALADDFVIPGQREENADAAADNFSGELVWFSPEGALPAPAQKGWYVGRIRNDALFVLAYITCSGYAYTCRSFIYELPDEWDMCLTQASFEDIAAQQFENHNTTYQAEKGQASKEKASMDGHAGTSPRTPTLKPLLLGASIPQHISYAQQRDLAQQHQQNDANFYQENMVPRAFMRDLQHELREATLLARSSEFDIAARPDEHKRVPHVFARGTTDTLENIVATAASWCDKAFYAHQDRRVCAGEFDSNDVFEALCSEARFEDEGLYAYTAASNSSKAPLADAAHTANLNQNSESTSGRLFVRNPFTKTLCEVALFSCTNHAFTCTYSLFKAYTQLRDLLMPSCMAYAYVLFVQRPRVSGCLPAYTLPSTLCKALVEDFQESFVRVLSVLYMPRYDTALSLAPAYAWLRSHLEKTRARWLYFPSLLGEYFIQHDGYIPYKFSIRPANDHAYDVLLKPRDMLEIESVLNAFGALVRRFGDTLVLFNQQEFQHAARGVLYSVAWDLKPVKPSNEARFCDGADFDVSPIDQIQALVRSINPYSVVNRSLFLRARANVHARHTQERLKFAADGADGVFASDAETGAGSGALSFAASNARSGASDAHNDAAGSAWNVRRRLAHAMATLPSVFRYFSYFKCDNSFHDVDFYYIALDESMMAPWLDTLSEYAAPSASFARSASSATERTAGNSNADAPDIASASTSRAANLVPAADNAANNTANTVCDAADTLRVDANFDASTWENGNSSDTALNASASTNTNTATTTPTIRTSSDAGVQIMAQRLARLLGLSFAARAFSACPLLQRVHVHAYKKRWDVLFTNGETHEEFSDAPWFEYTFVRTQFSSTRAYSAVYSDPQWLFAAFAPYFKAQERAENLTPASDVPAQSDAAPESDIPASASVPESDVPVPSSANTLAPSSDSPDQSDTAPESDVPASANTLAPVPAPESAVPASVPESDVSVPASAPANTPLPAFARDALGASYAADLEINFRLIDDAHIASICDAIAHRRPLRQLIASIRTLSAAYEQKYAHDSLKRSMAASVLKSLMERLVRDDTLTYVPLDVLHEQLDGAQPFRAAYREAHALSAQNPADAYQLLLRRVRNNPQATFMLDYHNDYCYKVFYSYSERLLYNLAHAQRLFTDQPALGACDNRYRVVPAPCELHACFLEMITCATRIPRDVPSDSRTSYKVITVLMQYALKLAPFHVDSYISVALCMLRYDKCDDAIDTLHRALHFAWKPSLVGTCYYVLACAYAHKGNDELSAICYKKALEFNVDYSTLALQPTLRASIGAHIARFSQVYTDDLLVSHRIPLAVNQQVLDAFLRGAQAACEQNLLLVAHDVLQDYLDYSGDSILTSVCNSCLETARAGQRDSALERKAAGESNSAGESDAPGNTGNTGTTGNAPDNENGNENGDENV